MNYSDFMEKDDNEYYVIHTEEEVNEPFDSKYAELIVRAERIIAKKEELKQLIESM